MKRIAVALVIVAVAASPAMAAKKKSKRYKAEPTVAELNDNGYRFVRDSMPIYWPTIVKLMVYSNQKPSNKK
jgi:hypothetical protein